MKQNVTLKFQCIALRLRFIDRIIDQGSDNFNHRFHPPHPRGFCHRNHGPSGKQIVDSSSGIPDDDIPETPASSGADLASRADYTGAAEKVKDAAVWRPIHY